MIHGGWRAFSVPVWGRHHLTSALAAVAIGRTFGLSVAEISRALSDFSRPRCVARSAISARRVINDAYNSNPLAMRAALEVLREDSSMGQRIVVCGDMRDLGSDGPVLHRQTGDEVVTVCGADVLVACGDHADEMVAGAIAAGMPRERTWPVDCPRMPSRFWRGSSGRATSYWSKVRDR